MLIDFSMLFLIVTSYAIGSVSFAVIVSKVMSLPSPYSYGSENPGATNVLRSGNKLAAVLTLLGDAAKGVVAVHFVPTWISTITAARIDLDLMAGFALLGVLFGHIYPIFHSFKGGKGVATTFGGLVALDFRLGVSTLLVWLIVSLIFRYSSLAAIFSAVIAPLFVFLLLQDAQLTCVVFLVAVILISKHYKNIINLMKGVESKIGDKNKKI